MYKIPIINWTGMVEYLRPLLFNLGEYKSLDIKETSAELSFEFCKLLFHYDAQDRFIATYLLDSSGIIEANHMILISPTFDYFLNGSFKKYLETKNTSKYNFKYSNKEYIIFDYIITILNSKGLENFISIGLKINEYSRWLKENGPIVNKELNKLYNQNY